jgi:DNA modification methylase
VTYWLYKTDCIPYLRKRLDDGRKLFDLICADPPYNFGQKYADYDDDRKELEYRKWMYEWLLLCVYSLADTGSFWVFTPDEWAADIDLFLRDKLHRRNWIVWHYTFGQKATNKFTRSHTHILYFTKSKTDFTFNASAVGIPSARQLVYEDKRAAGLKPPDDVWCLLKRDLEPQLTPDTDTWLESRICGTFKERKNHSPNQIPLPIMERIVLSCSNVGSLVLDPFGGTFSTGAACVKHGRHFLGLDVSQECVDAGKFRLSELQLEGTER